MTFVFTVVCTYAVYYLYCRLTTNSCTCRNRLTGKTVLVTAVDTPIGYEIAKDMAARGAKVLIACCNTAKGLNAQSRIIAVTGNQRVYFRQVNMTSFASVRDFISEIQYGDMQLDILINNYVPLTYPNSLTVDGVVMEVQVNYFSPFLIATSLMNLMSASAPSRIINTSSPLHYFGTIDPLTFLALAHDWISANRIYANTQLATLLFTKTLSDVLEGTGVTVNCFSSGITFGSYDAEEPLLMKIFMRMFFNSPRVCAQTAIHLAVAPELENVSGRYFVNCADAKRSPHAVDPYNASLLWHLSEQVVYYYCFY